MIQDPEGTAKAADHTHEQTGGATGAYVHAHDGADAHWHDEFGEHHGEGMTPEEAQALSEHLWKLENVELTTVGVDIGSSTSHLMFARVHMQRIGQGLSSRFVVVNREVLWRSPILLTPYLDNNNIDADQLGAFIHDSYREADIERANVDSGAIILTGEALKRNNARAIADLFAEESGKFVCASAGHHLEALLAANGSGTVNLSRRSQQTLLNVDVGGGTCKFALVQNGEVLQTAAVAVGGRLLVRGDAAERSRDPIPEGSMSDGRQDVAERTAERPRDPVPERSMSDGRQSGGLVRIEGPARQVAEAVGVKLEYGQAVSAEDEKKLVDAWVEVLLTLMRQEQPTGLAAELMVTDPLPSHPRAAGLTFSGGVSEYIYFREGREFQDFGRALANELRKALSDGRMRTPVLDPGQGIRATVIGASQFTVQVSGNTITVSNEETLPLHNLPVLYPRLELEDEILAPVVASAIRDAASRLDLEEGDQPLALAFRWKGDPHYPRLRGLAEGISAGLPRSIERGLPLLLLTDRDVGKTLGSILKNDLGIASEVVSIDGVLLKEFDFVDIGEMIRPAGVVPVVIKSLLFSGAGERGTR